MARPILRVGKLKRTGPTTPATVLGHLARTRPTANADPQRTPLNRWLVGSADMDLPEAIRATMRAAGVDPTALRKDATLANDVVMSISPEWFRPGDPEAVGTWDEDRLRTFQAEAQAFLRKTFGRRVVCAVVHLDEATPHLQAVVVPIMKKADGTGHRLSGRDLFSPATLRSYQQAWEDRMAPHGVGPRERKSGARHTTLREYYGALEEARTQDGRISLEVSEPPAKALLETAATHKGRVNDWRKGEAKRLRGELSDLAREASRGRLWEAERRSASQLRGELVRQGHELAETRAALTETREELALSKDQVARLRAVPINEVAAALGHVGNIGPRENAIDLVKRAVGVDYQGALVWLAQRFGREVAGTAAREAAEPVVRAAASEPVVLSPAERTRTRAVRRQLDALAAPEYRVTVVRQRDGQTIPINMGRKRGEETERMFSRDEVLAMVPRLGAENARGAHLYLTPIDPACHFLLSDDLDQAGLVAFDERGYQPAVVMETSPDNFQAVLKVPVSAAPAEAVNEVFKDLNRDLGDPHIVGLRHPMRLAGFENRKEKHRQEGGRFPFVVLVSAVNRLCQRTAALARAYVAQADLPTPVRRPGR